MFPNGPFGNMFPYTNFHSMNLDWVIQVAKDFLDQYTHIQEIIETGETSITDKTAEGIQGLEDKAEALQALLDEWYNEHSEDADRSRLPSLRLLVRHAGKDTRSNGCLRRGADEH